MVQHLNSSGTPRWMHVISLRPHLNQSQSTSAISLAGLLVAQSSTTVHFSSQIMKGRVHAKALRESRTFRPRKSVPATSLRVCLACRTIPLVLHSQMGPFRISLSTPSVEQSLLSILFQIGTYLFR